MIRRELAYRPGEVFRATPIQESQRRLSQLGLFDSIEIEVLERENPTEGASTRVQVTESDHTQFTYSFGYGTDTGAFGEGGWRHLNFLGGARTTSIRGRWSWLDRGVEGTFVEPYVFGRGPHSSWAGTPGRWTRPRMRRFRAEGAPVCGLTSGGTF